MNNLYKKSSLYKNILKSYEETAKKVVNNVIEDKPPIDNDELEVTKESVLNKTTKKSEKMKKNEFFSQITATIEALNRFILNKK